MGTDRWDEDTPCPCGNGVIRKTIEEPDHCWISMYNRSVTYELLCSHCSCKWMIMHGGDLIERTLGAKLSEVSRVSMELSMRISKVRSDAAYAMAQKLEPVPPKNKKAEMALLANKYVPYGGCYSTYLRDRKEKDFYRILSHHLPKGSVAVDIPEELRVAYESSKQDVSRASEAVNATRIKAK